MREIGKVKKVEGEHVVVHLDSADPSCGGCCGCAPQPTGGRDIEVKAIEGIEPGDAVRVDIARRSQLWGTMMLFVLTMAMLIGGVVAGYLLFPESGADGKVNLSALLMGVGMMVGWYILVAIIERYVLAPLPPPRIVEKVSAEELAAAREHAQSCPTNH